MRRMKRLAGKRFPISALALFCVSLVVLQGVALGHDHDHDEPDHDVHCACVYADKIEWSIDVPPVAQAAQAPFPTADQVVRITVRPNRISFQKARAPPIV